MSTALSKAAVTGLFFLFIFLSGYWLSRSGKPYNNFIFNIHKLIGLAAGVFLVVTVYRAQQAAPLVPAQIAALTVTVLVFAGLVAAGGLIGIDAAGGLGSIDPSTRTAISLVHKTFPYLALLSTGATLYLLLGGR
jgi:hypothetical protein